jgi:hypothetical protein
MFRIQEISTVCSDGRRSIILILIYPKKEGLILSGNMRNRFEIWWKKVVVGSKKGKTLPKPSPK